LTQAQPIVNQGFRARCRFRSSARVAAAACIPRSISFLSSGLRSRAAFSRAALAAACALNFAASMRSAHCFCASLGSAAAAHVLATRRHGIKNLSMDCPPFWLGASVIASRDSPRLLRLAVQGTEEPRGPTSI
jgi:hypothetical protein